MKVHGMDKGDLQETDGGDRKRDSWGRNIEFVLACIGNAVGLGNLWRFPYLCYSSGGGAFLIPYFIMLILVGIPLLYLELGVGQFTQKGPIGALGTICPLFIGVGVGTTILSFIFVTYYNVILSWGLFYLFSSFTNNLPWSRCDNSYNTDACWITAANDTRIKPNLTKSPTREFYENRVLQQSDGITNFGTIQWELSLILLLTWILVYFCLFKGVRWTGKVVYFTAVFPYVVIIALLVRGLLLPGSHLGVDFFVKPRWELLKDPKVWVNAASQNFHSIGIAYGSMITFASYKKKSEKLFGNVLIICLINSATSILAGFAVFSILGHIAFKQGVDIDQVATGGPGLVFIIYPEAFTSMVYPVGQIFSVLFFFMLLCLAIDSQFAGVEVLVTAVMDHFGYYVEKYLKRKEFLVLVISILCYFLSLPHIFEGGIYYFKILDHYSSSITLFFIALLEVTSVAWIFGAKRLATNLKRMTGRRPFLYFIICWYVVSPALITAVMLFGWIRRGTLSYGTKPYPLWANVIGWMIGISSLLVVPAGAIYSVVKAEGSNIVEKFLNSLKCTIPDEPEDSLGIDNDGYKQSMEPGDKYQINTKF